ncbi:MAG: helix-turn-helix transcriptional regulator [Clostridiaceae bacterium]|nr:helix-turn-helix transcriptional regulator [Clostridiaceae bacterium]
MPEFESLFPGLQDLQKDADLFQAATARRFDTAQQQYNKYEQGVQPMPVRYLIALADCYKTSVDHILF